MKKKNIVVLTILVALLLAGGALAAGPKYSATLTGAEEVPPTITIAHGDAAFRFNDDNSSLSYKVVVRNILDVVAAHIHCAPAGTNGPVGVTLYSAAPGGEVDGILVVASVAAPDAGNACGWTTLADVHAAMDAGNAYINVHTSAVPSGLIRGQIALDSE
jgi:hypothetical protein